MKKETIELVKKMIEDGNLSQEIAEKYCPELKESEDEKIRKEFCKDIWTFIPNEKAHKYIAWLEKHTIVPKFRIGDTIQNKITNEVFTISNRSLSLGYYHNENHSFEVNFTEQDDWVLVEQKPVDKVEPITDGLNTEFQKQVSYLITSAINREHEYTQGYVSWVAQSLLGYARNELKFMEWSEEDIVAIDCAVEVLSKNLPSLAASIERLKSLHPQKQWKPTEEQINSLERVLTYYGKGTKIYTSVEGLLEQLKAL